MKETQIKGRLQRNSADWGFLLKINKHGDEKKDVFAEIKEKWTEK